MSKLPGIQVKPLSPYGVMILLWPDPQAPHFVGSWDMAPAATQMRVLHGVRALMTHWKLTEPSG